MTKQTPFMAVITMTGAAIQYTDPNAAVPPAAGAGTASEPVQQPGVRIIPKLLRELTFMGKNGNAAGIQIGVRVGSNIGYGVILAGGQFRRWGGSDTLNVPIDLTDFYFLGTAADVLLVSGLTFR